MQNERAKNKSRDDNGHPLTSNGMAFNLIPWGADQTQFQQQTIENVSNKSKERRAATPSPFKYTPRGKSEESASRSDRGALGMDFLDFQPKGRKRASKRKSSYQNTTKEKRIEIEEKDSIEVEKDKVSYAQIKKTTIYNKKERDNNDDYELKKEQNKKNVLDLFKKHKRQKLSKIKVQLDMNPTRSRSAKSASRKRNTSSHSHKEIHDYIKNQNNKRKLKDQKEFLKVRKENLKMKRQLNCLQSFVSKNIKGHLLNDRTYDGVVPQEISKKLKSKQRPRSKTPRNFNNKRNKLSFAKNPDRMRNVRPSTGSGFYPITVQGSHSAMDISPQRIRNKIMPPKEVFKSYDTIDRQNLGKSEEKDQNRRSGKNSISQSKFKINPSPYKRREKSIDELIHHLQDQIDEIEMLEAKTIKKHSFGIRPKSKQIKKKKKAKARSFSPQGTSPQIRKVTVAPPVVKKQIMRSIEQNEIKQPVKLKKISKSGLTSRNKNTNATTIEGENRPLKMKSISSIKDKSSKKPRTKQASISKKPKMKKNDKLDIVKTLKAKVENVKHTRDQIYNKAALIIQRCFRANLQRKLQQQKEAQNRANNSGNNRDIQSLQSSPDEVIEKKVIIDIHTNNKDESYQRNKNRKRSKHNFSFGNDANCDSHHEASQKYSKDTDFERFKRKRREDRDYQFKKKGRNIFDSDKGEEAEEAYDCYDIKSCNDDLDAIEVDILDKRLRGKKCKRIVEQEQEKKLDFSSRVDNSYAKPESYISSEFSEGENR